MFSRVAVNTVKVLRRGCVRGLLVPSARALPAASPRLYAVSSRAFAAPSLAEVLATELLEAENDKQVDQDLRDVTKEMSKIFTITDDPGNAEVILKRKYKSEEIEVKFHCQDENTDFNAPDDFNEEQVETTDSPEEMNDEYGMDFTVTIKKGGNKMEFMCNAGQTININQMRYIPSGNKGDLDALESLYRGPQFDNLDEALQDSLLQYLSERGVGEDLSFFIISYARDKEEREYQKWLNQLIKFVE